MTRSLVSQLPLLKLASLLIYLPLLALVLVVGVQERVPLDVLFRDPAQSIGFPIYTGVFSYLGILLWCATLSICALTSLILWRGASATHVRAFLFSAAILTGILMLDDLFLIHEVVAPHFGLSQEVVLATYGLLAVAFLFRFRQEILWSHFLLLVLAMIFFALSVLVDLVVDLDLLAPSALTLSRTPFLEDVMKLLLSYFFEDVMKLFGIMSWLLYYGTVCVRHLRPADTLDRP